MDEIRLGIISDIHGDLPSLMTALECLQRRGVDRVVCAGDVVERGSDDHGVVAYLRQHGIPCVQGNHDENAVRHAELCSRAGDLADHETPLNSEAIEFLKTLPSTLALTFADTKFLLAHATPSENGAPVFHDSACSSLSKRVKKDLARLDADFLIVGHTHFAFDIRYKGKRVINPGSVCNLQSRDSHTCGVLDLSDQTFSVLALATDSFIKILEREYE